jgi:hypothetical protein
MSQRPPSSFTSDGTRFADLIIDGRRETWWLRGKRFQRLVAPAYYERTWDAPSPAALNGALNVLEAQAQFDGPQRKVSVRIRLAEHDLADEFWRCIEIGPKGWRIAEDPPIRFRRSAGMQSTPGAGRITISLLVAAPPRNQVLYGCGGR